jgi:1,4-alpha-glucan branching enzyme
LYTSEPALYEKSFVSGGFEWIEGGDAENSVLVYSRKGNESVNDLVIILNLTPVPRNTWRIGLPAEGKWRIILNSDDQKFYGSGLVKDTLVISEQIFWHGKEQSGLIYLPPLGGLVLKLAN